MRGGRLAVALVASAAATACVVPFQVKEQLDRTTETIALAHKVYAPLCAPEELANAQAHLDFTRIELSQGYVDRAEEHIDKAHAYAIRALEISTPCGGVDRDADSIPDIADVCPDEVEDFDGDNDRDGCRDMDPYEDDDGDGIINLEDGCVDEPEDLDGHADEDGCPETSEDTDGDGIVNAVDACPEAPEDLDAFADTDGCPDLDNDNDGILDMVDQCTMVAEDRDDWDDEDGCPDPDNDLDGIPDVNDACPNEPGVRDRDGCPLQDSDKDGVADANDRCPDQPETRNDYLDEDGCPDTPPSNVKVTRTRVQIKEMVQFETASATLLPTSDRILDDVVQVLRDAPYLSVRVEGHTDSNGSDSTNMRLSQSRAESVMRYLRGAGIESGRLTAMGFGETRPIDTNRTSSGRAKNRRVEFHILQDDE
ncbi:MAG: OmpA family protein [Myxococcales bacterium]|nr:OmpA family protein [Myxococcales bacterium]